jgi:hypothetical protein
MKKIISLLLCAILLCGCSALAETAGEKSDLVTIDINGRFRLQGILPEGYRFSITSQSDLAMEGVFSSADPAAPEMSLYISFNEIYANVQRLNDLSEEELELIRQGFAEDNDVSFDMAETSLGTKLLVVRETGADRDFLDFYSIYLGHEIELKLVSNNEASGFALTDAQMQMCIKLLSDMDFVPVE